MATQVTKPIISIIGGTQAGIRVLTQLLKQNNIHDKVTLQLYEQESEVYYPDLLPYMSTNHISSFKCSKPISQILPKEVNIIRENPAEIDTKNQALLFESGEKHHYDYLILALDKQDEYQDVKGKETFIENSLSKMLNRNKGSSSKPSNPRCEYFKLSQCSKIQ